MCVCICKYNQKMRMVLLLCDRKLDFFLKKNILEKTTTTTTTKNSSFYLHGVVMGKLKCLSQDADSPGLAIVSEPCCSVEKRY